ncbi:MAG: arylsulfatase, partial [Oscillospiraceae bacterium]|nr:arylsulfatase [Oscillospiraceae bacterium]
MAKNPNIIFFLTDDLGYGDVSCMNPDSKIHTSHIDQLAQEGMRFTDCHASSAVCSPSRYALLTGRYNWRSELKNLVLPGTSRALIEPGRETIASMLKKQGYRTACVGKWHLGMDWETVDNTKLTIHMPLVDKRRPDLGLDYTKPIKNGPNAKGFDYYFGMAASLDQAPYLFIENEMAQAVPDCTIGSDDCDHASPGTEFLYDKGPAWSGFDLEQAVPTCDQKVLDLIDEYAGGEEPFFIYYPTLAVHGPLLPIDEYKGRSGLGAYGDFVLQVDGFIGRLIDKLEEKGIAEDTIVVFTSDNGCSSIVGFEELAKHGHNPNYIFRGSKSDIWEGGHRVPMIIRWPGHIQPGTTCGQTMCLVAFFATFAEI